MILDIKNLHKAFPISKGALFGIKGHVQAVKDISFTVEKGHSLGIVGESGSGKTTLVKILAGFLKADRGSAFFDGKDLLFMKHSDRPRLVQMVFQDPFASLNPKLLLSTQLLEALKKRKAENPLKEAGEWMVHVGLEESFLTRYPHQLSGGQRQRFAIARALAMGPELLLADEPVSSLDLSVQAQIIKLLNGLRKELKFTQIVISHDLSVIANMCDQVLVMKDGEMVEQGSTAQVLSHPTSPYTQRLLKATPIV